MASLLIVVALAAERRAVVRVCPAGARDRVDGFPIARADLASHEVWVLQAGVGPERARSAVNAARRVGRFHAVWSVGFAGGLAEHLPCGAVVIPDRVLIADPLTAITPDPMRSTLQASVRSAAGPVITGPLVTVTSPVTTPAAKRRLAQRTGAVAVDMEAAGVADAAGDIGAPWLALKTVLDVCGDEIPAALTNAVRPSGDLSVRGVVGTLTALPALFAFGRSSRIAATRLQAALGPAISTWAALTPPGLSSTMRAPGFKKR